MSARWGLAAVGFLFTLAPAAAAAFRANAADRLVGLELTVVVAVLFLVAHAEALHRTELLDLAVVTAVLGFGGALVFARFLARWL